MQPSPTALIVLHSARSEERTYVLNTAHMSHWAGNKYPAGSAVWMAGNEDPLLVSETPEQITDLFMDGGSWNSMRLTEHGRVAVSA